MTKKNVNDYKSLEKEIRLNKWKFKLMYLSIIIGFLFYEFGFGYSGISIFIFVGVLISGFIIINKVRLKSYIGILFMIISILLSISYGIYTNSIFRTLNKIIIPVMLILSFLLVTYPNIQIGFASFLRLVFGRIFYRAIPNMTKIFMLIGSIINTKVMKDKNKKIKNMLLGMLVSIPILIIICSILSNADKVFGYYINDISNNINCHSIAIIICRILVSTLIGVFIFSLYSSFFMELEQYCYHNNKYFKLNTIMIITVLMLVSIVYIFFTKIQICYLYIIKTLPEGLTYSEYARNGFFQLLFIILINVSSVILLKRYTEYSTNVEEKILSSLYSIITILSFNMTFSALYKMKLYIVVFGFTRLRVLVSIFMCFLSMILVLLLIFIWKDINLFKPIIVCSAIIYVAINFFNIDEFITKSNLNLLSKSKSIDIYYLSTLSFDNYKSMTKAYKEGLIPIEYYNSWLLINKKQIEYFYEYNYYLIKGNSLIK